MAITVVYTPRLYHNTISLSSPQTNRTQLYQLSPVYILPKKRHHCTVGSIPYPARLFHASRMWAIFSPCGDGGHHISVYQPGSCHGGARGTDRRHFERHLFKRMHILSPHTSSHFNGPKIATETGQKNAPEPFFFTDDRAREEARKDRWLKITRVTRVRRVLVGVGGVGRVSR